jgi:hypothetical protein
MAIDYSKYPKNWKTEIRPKVLERANHKCEFCGIDNYSHVHSFKDEFGKTVWKYLSIGEWYSKNCPKLVKVILTIAHLDHDETNMEVKLSRLAALCQLCHLRYDAPEKLKRRNERN